MTHQPTPQTTPDQPDPKDDDDTRTFLPSSAREGGEPAVSNAVARELALEGAWAAQMREQLVRFGLASDCSVAALVAVAQGQVPPDGALDRSRTAWVLGEVAAERSRQDAKWGEQNHPDGTGAVWEFCSGQHAGWAQEAADDARRRCQEAVDRTWGDTYALILNEEVAEAFAEDDPTKLREELLQVAAVAVAWVEKLDREAEAMYGGSDQ